MSQKNYYLAELVFCLSGQVLEDISTEPSEIVTALPDDCYVSQAIIGDEYEANTAIYGNSEALAAFASAYAKFDVSDEDRDEVLADFLNLANGLFIVSLSDTLGVECTLSVPNAVKGNPIKLYDETSVIPMTFPFGTVNFVYSENP